MEEETISILDRDKIDTGPTIPTNIPIANPKTPEAPKPKTDITVEREETADIVLPLIILIIFIAFFGWMLYLLFNSNFQVTTPTDPVITDKRQPTYFLCPTGSCAINLLTGVKTCPSSDNEALPYNPSESTCSSRFLCDNPLAPYAVQSDGSTNINGICEPNVECQCLNVSQCPNYVVSAFTTSNGNPYVSLQGQRITFPQISSYINSSGQVSVNTPIQFNDPSVTFCAAPISWLPFSNPGCNFINPNEANNITYQDIITCMGLPLDCNGVISNPCLQGTLAFVTSNPDTLTQSNLPTSQVSCVTGEPCPCGLAAIYDTNFGNIICREIPP